MARNLRYIEPDIEDMDGRELPPDFALHTDEFGDEHIERGAHASQTRERALWKGALAGALAGLAAGWVMVKFQETWSSISEAKTKKDNVPEHRAGAEHGEDHVDEGKVDATVRAGNHISKALLHHELTNSEAKWAGPTVHYAFSMGMGALYGALAEYAPVTRTGFGNAFGALLFVGADEIAVPALGLSGPPQKVPLSKHFYGLVSHLVFGTATEGIYRGARKALDHV